MLGLVMGILFWGVPVLLLVFLGVSIYRYTTARRAERKSPGSQNPRELSNRKNLLIIASVLVGATLLVVIGFIALLIGAIAFM